MQSLGWTFLAPSLPAAVHSICPPCFFLWARNQLLSTTAAAATTLSARLLQPGKFRGNGPRAPETALDALFPFCIETKMSCHVVAQWKTTLLGVGYGPLVCTCLWGSGWFQRDRADKDVKHGMLTNLPLAVPTMSLLFNPLIPLSQL